MSSNRFIRGFSLIELLVVITIVTMLASLILPTFSQARQLSKALKCGTVQHGFYVALSAYAVDNREYPTNYNRQIACSWNWGDECAGWGQGGPPSQTSFVYNTAPFDYPLQGASAYERLFISGVLGPRYDQKGAAIWQSNPAILCTADVPIGWNTTGNSGTTKYFTYNGPQCNTANISNNGGESGLYYLGRHSQGETWGISYRYNPVKYRVSDIAFLGCPTFLNTTTQMLMEPHGKQRTASYIGIGYSNAQTDSNSATLSYDRNYTFGDGHTSYLVSNSRANIPLP